MYRLLHRSPSKSKKTKAFKFPSKKEKREKSREKEAKEKDAEKEKDKKKKEKDEKDIEKEKRKDKDKDKSKQKLKDRKKGKHEGLDIGGKIIIHTNTIIHLDLFNTFLGTYYIAVLLNTYRLLICCEENHLSLVVELAKTLIPDNREVSDRIESWLR